MKKLWQNTTNFNSLIEEYTSGDDILLDQNLVDVDIYCSIAHAKMLEKQKLIDAVDFKNIKSELTKILNSFKKNVYILKFGDEDVHTRVENDLTKKFPESGAKLHTGRSRNDQVLVDIRLFTKIQLIEIALNAISLSEDFYKQAKKLEKVPMPGMTHMQPAMLSSCGLWLGSFSESLLDDILLLKAAFDLSDQSPLGSGAAYGVTLPLDREYAAKLLGFSKVQNNALYCQNSKGKFESAVLGALCQIMATLNKFATDSLLFTTEPFAFISFDKSLGTGSSIMPQKQNWDALELMRAKFHQLVSSQLQLNTTLANLPSGYNRDLQQTKGSLIEAFKTTNLSIQVASLYVNSMVVNHKEILVHIPKELFAAHWAYELVKKDKMPFRNAYMHVKNNLEKIPDYDSSDLLDESISQGSTGNLNLEKQKEALNMKKLQWKKEKSHLSNVINKLIKK